MMKKLKNNIEAVLQRKGETLAHFLEQQAVGSVEALTLTQLQQFCTEENLDWRNLLLSNLAVENQAGKIKLLILDVDGVMTDGGMFFTENGDQFKKYNAKDGMAILDLPKYGILPGIISSGFKSEMVKSRAELLKIDHFYVGRQPKIEILKEWCEELRIELSEVAMIGDDINDLSIIREVGFSACPADAVQQVKEAVSVVLSRKGGDGCVRELIDTYLLPSPITL